MKYSHPIIKSALFILCILLWGSLLSCDNTAQNKPDPVIPFRHKTHIENYNIDNCGTCHKYSEHGMFKALPSIGECTACHQRDGVTTGTDRSLPRKKTIFDNYTDKDRPWVSQSEDQVNVYYSHKAALSETLADGTEKLKCDSCHLDKISSGEEPVLSGGKLMDKCIDCHNTFNMNNQCGVCHSRRNKFN